MPRQLRAARASPDPNNEPPTGRIGVENVKDAVYLFNSQRTAETYLDCFGVPICHPNIKDSFFDGIYGIISDHIHVPSAIAAENIEADLPPLGFSDDSDSEVEAVSEAEKHRIILKSHWKFRKGGESVALKELTYIGATFIRNRIRDEEEIEVRLYKYGLNVNKTKYIEEFSDTAATANRPDRTGAPDTESILTLATRLKNLQPGLRSIHTGWMSWATYLLREDSNVTNAAIITGPPFEIAHFFRLATNDPLAGSDNEISHSLQILSGVETTLEFFYARMKTLIQSHRQALASIQRRLIATENPLTTEVFGTSGRAWTCGSQ